MGTGITMLAAGLAAAPAFAQSWYAGAGAGRGNLNMSGQDLTGLTNASVNDTDTTYSARVGYKFSPYGAFEVGYYDLGHYQFSGTSGGIAVSGSAKAKSYGIAIVASPRSATRSRFAAASASRNRNSRRMRTRCS